MEVDRVKWSKQKQICKTKEQKQQSIRNFGSIGQHRQDHER